MKKSKFIFLSLMILMGLMSCEQVATSKQTEGNQVTFKLDMTGVEIPENAIIGLRGDTPPLSWTETIEMKADDKSKYMVTVDFPEAEAGQMIHYKFVMGEDTWELSKYGPVGNRFLILKDGLKQVASGWDKLEDFSPVSLLTHKEAIQFYNQIYLIGNGKKRGLSIEEIVAEESAFWGDYSDTWMSNLEDWLIDLRINQAANSNGHFKMIEQSPTKVVVEVGPPWWESAFNWIQPEGEELNGVTRDDLKAYDEFWRKTIAQQRNWKIDAKENGERITITAEVLGT